jgi:hypothetical protein
MFFALFARNNFVDKTQPFPSWTYNHSVNMVNTLTSWDSGFYYDLAKTGYQNNNEKLPMANVLIAPDSWVKVFTGSGIVGKDHFTLPFSENGQKVNNVILAFNGGVEPANFPIYYAYSGIPYCEYRGPIDFDRDVLSASEALTNPTSCGDRACTASYVTYYDALAEKVVFQELFTAESSASPTVTMGTTRPVFNTEQEYLGSGCKTIANTDITNQPLSSYKTSYSTFGFMPLYSLLARMLAFVVQDVVVAGLIISFVSLILSVLFFYKLVRELVGDSVVAFWGSIAFMVLPASFFAITFQPVALFLLFFVLAALSAIRGKTAYVGLFVALLVLTHVLGIFALIPIFYLGGKNKKSLILNVVVVLGVLLGVSVYFYIKTTDPFVLLSARMPWYGGAVTFVGSFVNYFLNLNKYALFEVFLSVLFVGLMLVVARAQSIKQAVSDTRLNAVSFATMFALMSLFNGGFAGMLKFVPVVLLPLCVYLGVLLTKKRLLFVFLLLLVLLNITLFCLWTISSRFVI